MDPTRTQASTRARHWCSWSATRFRPRARRSRRRARRSHFSSDTVKAYRAQLPAQRNDFKQWLRANAPAANVTGEFDISLNAVSVKLNGTTLATLSAAPMVQQVEF